MKTFVFAYDRFDSMTTANALASEDIEHIVLCHTEEAKQKFIECGTALEQNLINTNQPKGLGWNRNAALDMMENGEWALFLVDDLKSLSVVDNYQNRTDSKLGIDMDNQKDFPVSYMKQRITMRTFIHYAQELISVCESLDTKLGGFCGIDNPPFRDSKWKFNSLVDGRAWVVQKSKLRFDMECQANDDMSWTLQNIQKFGVVVVNNWILPDFKRWAPGGMGTIEERMPLKIAEAEYLVNKYPGSVKYAKKAGWPDNAHISLTQPLPRNLLPEYTQRATTTSNLWRKTNPPPTTQEN